MDLNSLYVKSERKLALEHIFVDNLFLKQQITKASFREIVKCKLPLNIIMLFVYN